MSDPVLFMRRNIKGQSDISVCDHGNWFRDPDGECTFIEGRYIINREAVVLTCGMLRYINENKVPDQFDCQNCGNVILDCDLTEFLLCANCDIPVIVRGRNGSKFE